MTTQEPLSIGTIERPKRESGSTGRRRRRAAGLAPGSKGRDRKFDRDFIGWDGEGYNDTDGVHHYMMLVASTGDYLMAPEGRSLHTSECLELFCRVARQNPRRNHVIFAGGYDFNMLLGDLNRYQCELLHKKGYVYFGPYRVEHRKRKSVNIHNRETGDKVIIYDAWSFFATSFVKVLDAWGITDETAKVASGKQQRANFRYEDRAEILAYCRAELVAFVALMERFRDGLREADIIVEGWYGPGAVAGALYKKHHTKAFKTETEERVNRAGQRAYFGGRIEQVQFGNHDGPVWYYDINSAYPYAISQLPSLASGRWRRSHASKPPIRALSLYHLAWDFESSPERRFYPLPFRRKDGSIAFFLKGQGWYHAPEYGLVADSPNVEVIESFIYDPCNDVEPFAWVREMYTLRRQWKQEGRREENILRLGLNSLYGKMVQQLGWTPERGIPPYHQLEWGGFVTSTARALLYLAAMTNPDAVIGFETDGVITTEPLSIDLGDELGQWRPEQYDGLTYVQPGVYWLRRGDKWESKHRGFDPGSLTREMVLEGWERGDSVVTAASTRFIGMGLALQTDWRLWRRWETSPRDLGLWPDNPKRYHLPGPSGCNGICRPDKGAGSRTVLPSPARRLHRTALQWDNPGYWTGEESTPYPLQWRSGTVGEYSFDDLLNDREDDLYWEDL